MKFFIKSKDLKSHLNNLRHYSEKLATTIFLFFSIRQCNFCDIIPPHHLGLNVQKNYKDLFKCLQYRDDKYCRNDAPLFLLIGGGITLGMTALKLVAWLTPCECDDKLANFLSPLANLANFCVLIWGSVVVFGKNFPNVLHFLN